VRTGVLSRSVCDAVLAVGQMAEERRPMLVEDVSRATGVSRPSLAKLVSTLVRKGLVATRRGIGGGARLAHPAGAISLYDLCRALDDPILARPCLLGAAHGPGEPCPAGAIDERHHEEILAFLRRTPVLEAATAYRRLRQAGAVRR
jgi:Rrf2 family protein